MKNFKTFILLIITFVIGLHFNTITNYLKSDFKHSMHVQYCNDMYMGNDYRINACLQSKY